MSHSRVWCLYAVHLIAIELWINFLDQQFCRSFRFLFPFVWFCSSHAKSYLRFVHNLQPYVNNNYYRQVLHAYNIARLSIFCLIIPCWLLIRSTHTGTVTDFSRLSIHLIACICLHVVVFSLSTVLHCSHRIELKKLNNVLEVSVQQM